MMIVRPRRLCRDCDANVREGAEIQLYSFGFNDGQCVDVSHGCEHFLRGCYPDGWPPREWLARQAAESVQMIDGVLTDMVAYCGRHFHVLAVQDWGGSQEHWRGWDDQRTRGQAEQYALDMIEADTAYVAYHCGDPGDWARVYDAVRDKFGERFSDLASGNVNPGWDAIFIEPCGPQCGWSADREPATRPWWTSAESSRRHLRPAGTAPEPDEDYLRQLRETMADPADAAWVMTPHGRKAGYRVWPDRSPAALAAMLDGLGRLASRTGCAIYGFWLTAACDRRAPEDPDPGEPCDLWLANDRLRIYRGTFESACLAMIERETAAGAPR